MKLVFIYGPPASGKLTIAEKLSELTGIPLFHNHLTRDMVKDIYGDSLGEHYDLVDQIRSDVFDYCSRHDTDLIFTYVYTGAEDDANVKRYTEIIENNNGKVVFVELTASKEDLINRVDNESRAKFKKLTDRDIMRKIVEDLDNYSIPYVEAFKVNTSVHDSGTVAKLIASELSSYK